MGRSRICSPGAVEGPLIWVQPQDRLFLHLSQRWDWTRSIGCSLPPPCASPKERHVVGLYILPTARGRHELPVAANINLYVWLRVKERNVEPQRTHLCAGNSSCLVFSSHLARDFVCVQTGSGCPLHISKSAVHRLQGRSPPEQWTIHQPGQFRK